MQLIRNKLLWVLGIVGFLALGCKGEPRKEGALPETPAEVRLIGEEVSYATDSTEMKGYLAYDANQEGKRPGVLVVHEWWGHNDYTRKRADMLAELGYTALAVDMYGDGKQAMHPEDAGKFSGMVMQNIDLAQARFDAALELLKSQPTVDTEAIAAIGYCFGGSVSLPWPMPGRTWMRLPRSTAGYNCPLCPMTS